MRRLGGWMVAALCLSACAGDGSTEQVVTVLSDPPGAACRVTRENLDLGTVPQTPGAIKVSKSVAPLIVACNAAGYETITGGFEARYLGGTLFASRNGAPPAIDPRDYAYPDQLMITLRR
jgi:hypothetical protein